MSDSESKNTNKSLASLLRDIPRSLFELADESWLTSEVSSIHTDSREVAKNSIFFALTGENHSESEFVEQALKLGAKFIVSKNKLGVESNIISPESRKLLSLMLANYHQRPADSLKSLGITGTNGKTTVCWLVAKTIAKLVPDGKVLRTGTLGNFLESSNTQETLKASGLTTPSASEFQKTLLDGKKNGAQYLVSEVSSHAIEQFRTYGTNWQGAVLTNISRDHLDYHGTMEDYFGAKKKLFFR